MNRIMRVLAAHNGGKDFCGAKAADGSLTGPMKYWSDGDPDQALEILEGMLRVDKRSKMDNAVKAAFTKLGLKRPGYAAEGIAVFANDAGKVSLDSGDGQIVASGFTRPVWAWAYVGIARVGALALRLLALARRE